MPRSPQSARTLRLAIICLLLLIAITLPGLSSRAEKYEAPRTDTAASTDSPLVIRVGAIYYDDSAEQYKKLRATLTAIENAANDDKSKRPITFKPVVGTYDEVYHWYKRDQVDLAVMNPGPLALLLKEFGHDQLADAFVGTRRIEPDKTSIAYRDGIGARDRYNSVMFVNREAISERFPFVSVKSSLTEAEAKPLLDFILEKARNRQTHFLFVHPFSSSGYIFPRQFLADKTGVNLTLDDYELTYSHNASLNEIRRSGYDANHRLQVAFVSDETETTRDDKTLLAIRTGNLNTPIIQDALVFTPGFAQREPGDYTRIKELLQLNVGTQSFNLAPVDKNTWWQPYEQIGEWITKFNGKKPLMSGEVTLDQIIRRINNYNLHHTKAARVAIVLSGGGAKCAYQLGAVEQIEDQFQKARTRNGTDRPAIDLVVGTSGGAINALTIAAGVTKNDEGRRALRSTWESFDQSDILKPSDLVRNLLGLTLGFIFSLLVINASYNRHLRLSAYRPSTTEQGPDEEKPGFFKRIVYWYRKLNWSQETGLWLMIVSVVFYVLGLNLITLTAWLSVKTLLNWHGWIHFVEYGRQTLRWAAITIAAFGVFLYFDRLLASRRKAYGEISRKWLMLAVAVAILLLFALPVATLYTAFKLQSTLFVSSGIDEKMATEMPNLLHCNASTGSTAERLANISTQIIQRGLITRDLVITGSVLSSDSPSTQTDPTREQNETDLYFVYKAGATDLPEALLKDNRFVSLNDKANQSILLDAVIGSGSIFPAFEPKVLPKVTRVMDKNEEDKLENAAIIDGGFVHNSPIEAAVKLEATHIIMIEASPDYPPSTEINLLSNSVAAFNHLFTQAQLLDARSRRQAEVFTLRPHQDPYLCTMDFGLNYITEAMRWGAEDAVDTATPRFVWQPRPSGL